MSRNDVKVQLAPFCPKAGENIMMSRQGVDGRCSTRRIFHFLQRKLLTPFSRAGDNLMSL